MKKNKEPLVGVIMGSDSDLPVMEKVYDELEKFGIPYETFILSAHRTPKKSAEYAKTASARGLRILIAGAGHAAHLAGALAAHTTLPVIGVPIDSSCLNGEDALLSTVQMPPGIPVATMAIGKSGAQNAAIFAVQILATNRDLDPDLDLPNKLREAKEKMEQGVEDKQKKLDEYMEKRKQK